MTKTATVRTRIEPELKDQAEGVLKKIGLSPTEFMRMAYRQLVMLQGLPFEARIPNATTAAAIADYEKEKKAGTLKAYSSIEDFAKEVRGKSDN